MLSERCRRIILEIIFCHFVTANLVLVGSPKPLPQPR